MNPLIYITFLIAMCPWFSFGQEPAYFTLGEKIFRNTDIYTILYTEKNELLYVGTNNGVYVLKQGEFKKLTASDEVNGAFFFDLKESQSGEVFCRNMNGQIFKITADHIHLFYEIPRTELNDNFQFYMNGNQMVATSYGKIRYLDFEGNILRERSSYHIKNETDSTLMHLLPKYSNYESENIYFFSSSESTLYTHSGNGKIESKKTPIQAKRMHHILTIDDLEIGFGGIDEIAYKNKDVFIDFQIIRNENFFPYDNNSFIGLNSHQGVRILSLKNDTISEEKKFFNDRYFSHSFTSQNGTIFLGTFGEGIVVIPDINKECQRFDKQFVKIVVSPKNEAYLSDLDDNIYKIVKGKLEKQNQINQNIGSFFYLNGDFNLGLNNNLPLIYQENNILVLKDFIQIDSSYFFTTEYHGTYLYTKKEAPLHHLDYVDKEGDNKYRISNGARFLSVTWDPMDSLIYYSSNFGIFSRPWNSREETRLPFVGKHFSAYDLVFYKRKLICGTPSDGLLFYEDQKLINVITQKEGLQSNAIYKLEVFENYLFILNKEGLQIFDLEKDRFLNVGIKQGLFSKKAIDFALSNDQLWLLEKNGFYSIPLSDIKDTESISQLYIQSISVNGKKADYSKRIEYSFENNNLSIAFDFRDILTRSETEVMYKMENFDENWIRIPIAQNQIYYPFLPPGDFNLKIKAVQGNQESAVFSYAFVITPPYWKKWWFYLLFILVVILSTLALVMFFSNKQRKKLALKYELDNSKLTAIRSQMNPHFIFNSLNSIQHLVLKGETENTYTSINKFASLVRRTLDYSEAESIMIKEELDLIENYLALEKLRFKESFSYEIIPPENTEAQIPAMLIQPFIENAIVHGLLHKKGLKKLTVSFELGKTLICKISDNGVGRVRSKEIKKRQTGSYKSFSLNAIKKRFEILKNYYKDNLGYEYEDLTPEDDLSPKTTVTLTIPIIIEF